MKKTLKTARKDDFQGMKEIVHKLYLEFKQYERPDEELREVLKAELGNGTLSGELYAMREG